MLYFLLLCYFLFIIWLIIELKVSPRGYEDQSGFHYVEQAEEQASFIASDETE